MNTNIFDRTCKMVGAVGIVVGLLLTQSSANEHDDPMYYIVRGQLIMWIGWWVRALTHSVLGWSVHLLWGLFCLGPISILCSQTGLKNALETGKYSGSALLVTLVCVLILGALAGGVFARLGTAFKNK